MFPGDEETESGQVLLHSAGNLLLFHNVQTDEKTVLRSPAGSIGMKLVHTGNIKCTVDIISFFQELSSFFRFDLHPPIKEILRRRRKRRQARDSYLLLPRTRSRLRPARWRRKRLFAR